MTAQVPPALEDAKAIEGLRRAVRSQHHAALAMLRDTIEQCPERLWSSADHLNPFWRIAYHTLYYTHLYLQPNESAFRPWEHHQTRIQHMDDIPGPPETEEFLELPHRPPQTGEPYTRAQVLEYWTVCDAMVDDAVGALDLMAPESGFSWARIPKMEHQMVSIRHIQHHAAQLMDRLRTETGVGVDWVRSRHNADQHGAA